MKSDMLTQATLNGGLCLCSLLLRLQTSFMHLPNSCKYSLHRPDYAISILKLIEAHFYFLITVPPSELGQEEGTVQCQSNFPSAYKFLHLWKYSYGKDYSTMIQLPASTLSKILLLRKFKV